MQHTHTYKAFCESLIQPSVDTSKLWVKPTDQYIESGSVCVQTVFLWHISSHDNHVPEGF